MAIKQNKENTFQQTEIGLLPSDWTINDIVSIVEFRRGSFPQPYGLPQWYDDINGTPFVQVYDVDVNFRLKSETKQKVSDLGKTKSVFAKKGTIVLTIQGSIGRIAIIQYDAFIDRTLLIFSRFLIPICKDYFVYAVHKLFQIEKENAAGGTIKTITKEELSKFKLPLPPIEEQKAIAEALNDIDTLIHSLENLIEKKKAIKQGALHELLQPKDDWVERTLGEVVDDFVGGGTPSKHESAYWNGSIPWISVKNFSENISAKPTDFITKIGLSESASKLIPSGIPIITTRMAIGKVLIYEFDVAINQDLKAIFLKKEVTAKYFAYWFTFNTNLLLEVSHGSTVKGIDINNLKNIPFAYPTEEVQTQIVTIISQIEQEIIALEGKTHKYKNIKQGMMNLLLTGKVRLL